MAVPYEFVGPVDALGRVAATVINRLTPEGGKYPLPDYTKPRSTGMPVPVAQKPGQTQQAAQPPVAAVPSVETPKPVPQVTPTATTQQTNPNATYKWTDAGGQVNYGNVGAPSGATAMPAVGMPPPDHVAQANEAVQRNLRAAAIYRSMSDDANMHPVTRQAIAYQNAVNMGKADADIAEAAGTYGFGMEKQAAADRAAMERTQASADASIKAHEISAASAEKVAGMSDKGGPAWYTMPVVENGMIVGHQMYDRKSGLTRDEYDASLSGMQAAKQALSDSSGKLVEGRKYGSLVVKNGKIVHVTEQ